MTRQRAAVSVPPLTVGTLVLVATSSPSTLLWSWLSPSRHRRRRRRVPFLAVAVLVLFLALRHPSLSGSHVPSHVPLSASLLVVVALVVRGHDDVTLCQTCLRAISTLIVPLLSQSSHPLPCLLDTGNLEASTKRIQFDGEEVVEAINIEVIKALASDKGLVAPSYAYLYVDKEGGTVVKEIVRSWTTFKQTFKLSRLIRCRAAEDAYCQSIELEWFESDLDWHAEKCLETDASPSSLLNVPVVILHVGAKAPTKLILALTTPDLAHINGSFTALRKICAPGTVDDPPDSGLGQVLVEGPSPVPCSCSPIAPFLDVAEPTVRAIKDAASRLALLLMLKSKTSAALPF
ncbi:hypothetical protein DFH94DRAFT_798047 [Russula ochroleuca]|uniref:Uncharacterized protein n=1 Tax=Russula ochroleuca TaxID=152965 RepID=A0A9P5TEL1_9AGAM|nr:hypothetical protein DFH94DRAFT_798047 [Russula ochroleuca]